MFRRNAIKIASRLIAQTNMLRTLDRNNGRRGGVILVFHEISAETLSRQLAYLSAMYTFISLDEFVGRLTSGKSTSGAAAITFDDGLNAVTEAASSLAISRGWPMTFYLPTRYLDSAEPYWFLELDVLLTAAIGKTLPFRGSQFRLSGLEAVAATSKILRSYFKMLPTVEGVESQMAQIRHALFGTERRPVHLQTPQPIPWERVRQLSAHDELSFQAHTVNHLAVSCLTEDRLVQEMKTCATRIEEWTGRPVRHFCYPYGSPREVGTFAPDIVRKHFVSATTTSRGRCSHQVDLALLPRVPIDTEDSEEVAALKVGSAR